MVQEENIREEKTKPGRATMYKDTIWTSGSRQGEGRLQRKDVLLSLETNGDWAQISCRPFWRLNFLYPGSHLYKLKTLLADKIKRLK